MIVVTVDEYLRMIQGKTAALVGASVAIGARIGGATPIKTNDMLQFGQAVGMAFQIQDDILGIWGDPEVTGKAAGNDIVRRKKSLPLLYALNHAQTGTRMRALFTESADPVSGSCCDVSSGGSWCTSLRRDTDATTTHDRT